jgi:hypothetical protein
VGQLVNFQLKELAQNVPTMHNDPTTLPCVMVSNFLPREHLVDTELNDALAVVGDSNVGQA